MDAMARESPQAKKWQLAVKTVLWKSVSLAKILGSLRLSSPGSSDASWRLKVSIALREQSCLIRGLAINKADGCFAVDL